MREVMENLFVGKQEDYENGVFLPCEWNFVLAAKEPWHRSALVYTGRSADKNDPEYLIAKRENKLILNLVDAPKSIFFSKDIINEALSYIHAHLMDGKKVGVFCNEGKSRSTSIALLYLVQSGYIRANTLEDCEAEFMKVYPDYNPGIGMRDFVKENWDYYNTPF